MSASTQECRADIQSIYSKPSRKGVASPFPIQFSYFIPCTHPPRTPCEMIARRRRQAVRLGKSGTASEMRSHSRNRPATSRGGPLCIPAPSMLSLAYRVDRFYTTGYPRQSLSEQQFRQLLRLLALGKGLLPYRLQFGMIKSP